MLPFLKSIVFSSFFIAVHASIFSLLSTGMGFLLTRRTVFSFQFSLIFLKILLKDNHTISEVTDLSWL